MPGKLLFCGANRKRDLTRLIRVYDEVAAEAEGLLRGKIPDQPIHKVVLVHAERGLGKTRLALEFYRHLTQTRDLEHYWPVDYEQLADHVSVMPRAQMCRYEAALPFLWWGLSVNAGPNPGNTLFAALPDLLPHLFSMRIASRRRSRGRSLLKDFSDTSTDIGIEIPNVGIDVAGEVVGYGLFKRLGQSLFRIGKIVGEQRKDARHAIEEAKQHSLQVSGEVLADLDALLNPAQKHFARRPAVIFVDDSQYADRDQPLAQFVDRLISHSAQNRWPLLLILTHWSRSLEDWRDADDELRPRSTVAQVLHHALHQVPEYAGPCAQQPGAALGKQDFVEIDLGDPVTDLTPAFVEQFPGIEDQTVAMIVDLSGGNPRKLEQIVTALDREPSWFENHKPTENLTNEGRASVLTLSRLPIDDIVYDRLRDTPNGVRQSMALASLMGHRFVVDLVDRLSTKLLDSSARVHLEVSESRYRFLRNVCDRARNDIGHFADPLFLAAAEKYRVNARADFDGWPDDDEILIKIDQIFTQLVSNPSVFDGFSEDDFALALSIASDRMVENDNQLAGLALARLVHIENARGNFDGAYDAAARFIAGFSP